MEVILLTDLRHVGKKGETVTLKDGYARNLISKKQAAELTARSMNDLKLQKQHDEKVAVERLENAKELQGKLENARIRVGVKVGKDGKFFGSVSAKEIADACKNDLGFEIDKKKMVLPDPIKELGTTEVILKLHPEVQAKLQVEVYAL